MIGNFISAQSSETTSDVFLSNHIALQINSYQQDALQHNVQFKIGIEVCTTRGIYFVARADFRKIPEYVEKAFEVRQS